MRAKSPSLCIKLMHMALFIKPAAKVYSIALLQSWVDQRRYKYQPTEKRASY
jgi:hypothetical protein